MRKLSNYNYFDLIRRKKFNRKELRLLILKSFLREVTINNKTRIFLNREIVQRNFTRVRNRCLLTGRGRSLVRSFGLARMPFKLLLSEGRIPGFRRDMF